VLDAVAEAESLGVEPEEMEKRVGEQLAAAGERAGELRKHYSQPGAVADLKVGMLRDKAMDCLVEQATLNDVEVDPADVAAPLQTG
jgi:FKBP-type peptidyl-prolyl cis-trans isomerase (trigger factor)